MRENERVSPRRALRAWCVFNGTGTVAIIDHLGASSLVDNGTGDYTVNWQAGPTVARNACYIASAVESSSGAFDYLGIKASTDPTTGGVTVRTATNQVVFTDCARAGIGIIGEN